MAENCETKGTNGGAEAPTKQQKQDEPNKDNADRAKSRKLNPQRKLNPTSLGSGSSGLGPI